MKEAEDKWQQKEQEIVKLKSRELAAREGTLVAACERSDFAQVQKIISGRKWGVRGAKALVNTIDHGMGALHVACLRGSVQIATCLLKANADPLLPLTITGGVTGCGDTPVHFACRRGDVDILELLASYYVKGNKDRTVTDLVVAKGLYGRSPLHTATHYYSLGAVRWLLQQGASPSCRDDSENNNTPLHVAAKHGHLSITRGLLNAGADAHAKTQAHGLSPIAVAVMHGHLELTKFFLEQGIWLQDDERDFILSHCDSAEKHERVVFVMKSALSHQVALLHRAFRSTRGRFSACNSPTSTALALANLNDVAKDKDKDVSLPGP